MRFEPGRVVGVSRHISAVGMALLEQYVHDRAGERPVGAGQRRQVQIGGLGAGGAVGIDDDELGPALAPGDRDMGHHVDLGRHRVAAPDDDQVRFTHLAPVYAAFDPDAGQPAGIGERVADRQILARIAHRVAQPVDAVALHQAHGPGIIIGPDRLRAVTPGGAGQPFCGLVERVVPRNRRESGTADALLADPAQRLRQAIGMVLTLGVAGDLGADDAVRVALRGGPVHAPDARSPGFRRGWLDALDLERAGARAIVRAHAGQDVERQGDVPPLLWTQDIRI